MEKSDKPLSLVINEFRVNIENVINNSNLPPYIIEPILKDYYNQIALLSNNIYINEKEEYSKKIGEEVG